MEAYHISGGRPLRGSIAIHGAKNGVLPILAATLAVGGRCTLTNCPEIRDVDTALQILRHLGCKAERSGDVIETDAAGANRYDIPASLMRKMRAAVIFLGALLTGLGVYDKIGKYAGAGSIVPITGFANSVAAPAIEYKKEGQVFGIGSKIFTIAGPVILYGVFTSWILGLIYWVITL